ncbi:polysaccharide biosynthesis/export family protein [Roseibacillus persicicus]|uniref:polysaccharide biosynthesis/export family protein n=1 Tax=Roseibacillus persicicus TaxID=454148 RepID=UPI00280F3A60|nr:polysaccharide biosynthesis/export family protein [Roseibacillus persicicus]MDQ8190586.1 SLBB domain-containing protein [Roseibacillus persicicus]
MHSPTLRVLTALCFLLALIQGGIAADTYLLKGNDKIRLNVFGEPDMSREVQLTVTGEASLPLIGSVKLGGLSLLEAEEKITELYLGDYLISPQISVNLLNAADERVMVMGAVVQPGPVTIPANTSLDLVSALNSVGGLAPHAYPERIEVVSGDNSQFYDFEKVTLAGTTPVVLKHGDIVNVATNPYVNKHITILGEVGMTGQLIFPRSGQLDIETAIGMARGLTEEADPERITLKRNGKIYSGALSTQSRAKVMPGDILTVPKSRFVDKYVTMLGEVGKPGQIGFPVDGKLDLLTAISLAGGFDRLANKKKVTVSRQTSGGTQVYQFDVSDMEEGKIKLHYLMPGDSVNVPVRRF